MCFNLSNSTYVLRDEIQEIKRRKRKFFCMFDRFTPLIAVAITSGLQMSEENFLVLYENCNTLETQKIHSLAHFWNRSWYKLDGVSITVKW